MNAIHALITVIALSSCQKDETISGQSEPDDVWILVQADGEPVTATITIEFPDKGKLTGQGPCNRYFTTQLSPLPWFETGPIGSTKIACPDLAVEKKYFTALENMTLIERKGNTLLLTSDSGSLEFHLQ